MINKLYRSLLKIGNVISEKIKVRPDLCLHFIVSFMISFILFLLIKNPILPIGITLLIGIGKEIYDVYKTNPTGFDLKDLLADSLGIFSSYLIKKLIFLIMF